MITETKKIYNAATHRFHCVSWNIIGIWQKDINGSHAGDWNSERSHLQKYSLI